MAYEKRAYEVESSDGDFSVRAYAPAVVAETIVDEPFEDAGSTAFRILVAYIGGENETRESIDMTAPVTQEARSQKIDMTAPVTQERSEAGYRFTFLMPSEYTLETLPRPRDPRVRLALEPGGRFAAIRYSGFWSRSRYEKHLAELEAWMSERGLEAEGVPVWARYDPPFMPWFWRTNEILVPLTDG